jgi:sugar lactone lactonase YvrE
MVKLYFTCFLLLVIFNLTTFAQAPKISYTTPLKYTVGVKISPLLPASTGGAVPNEVYSKATTIAGNGFYGYKDTVASHAVFASPINVTYDRNGNIYVADANLNVIRKISKGVVTTLAGNVEKGAKNGQDTAARFQYPTGVVADRAGNVYVADFVNNMIRKITPSGLVSTFAGNVNSGSDDGLGTDARFTLPYSLAIDANDFIYVADTYNNRIRRITPDGMVTTFAGSGAPGRTDGVGKAATFRVPYSIAIDKDGDMYVADQGNNCIRKITKQGVVSTLTDTTFIEPVSVAVDSRKRLYLTTTKRFDILQFDEKGKQIGTTPFSGGSYKRYLDGTDTLSSYKGSMGLLFDGKDHLLVADVYNDYIRQVAVHGYTVTPYLPAGLSIDGTGTITGTPLATTPARNYTITAHNSSGSSSSTINIGVGIGSQTITFNKPADVTYGIADFSPNATSTDTLIAIVYSSSNPAVATIVNNRVHIVGAGTTTITANQPGNVNYTAAPAVSQQLVVNKAVLTTTANDIIKTDGTENPALTFNYKGFVNGEDSTIITKKPVLQTAVTATSPVGEYPITVGGAEAANYSFNYVPGKFTVFPIPVITAIGSTSIVKGKSVTLNASPSKGYTYQWSFNGNAIPGATDTTYTATETGGYSVSITANNYTTYSLYTSVLAQLKLPVDNFKLQMNSVTCKGSNNGSVSISAAQKLKYTAVVTGNNLNTPFTFTDTLTVRNLSPGNYTVCFAVEGEVFSQCYQVNVTEPKDLSVYSTINKTLNNINLQLDGGRNYNITLNDVKYNTTQKEITLPLLSGANKIQITTDNLCQGIFEKVITLNDKIIPYPNPFNNILYVNVGNQNISNVKINVVNLVDGKPVYNTHYANKSGILELDLSTLANGLYYLNLGLDNMQNGYKIIKK